MLILSSGVQTWAAAGPAVEEAVLNAPRDGGTSSGGTSRLETDSQQPALVPTGAVSEVEADEAPPTRIEAYPLPVNYHRGGLSGEQAAFGANERAAYSNTRGDLVIPLVANKFLSDDLMLLSARDCGLRRYQFEIVGKANPTGAGGAFRVDYALFDNCPGAGGQAIAGTSGFREFTAEEADAPQTYVIDFVVPDESQVLIPPVVWLGVKSNRANVGLMFGAAADGGFSVNRFDFPLTNCGADAGYDVYAAFNATLWVDGDCPLAYPDYVATQPGRAGFTEGANKCIADDVELVGDSCAMTAFRVGLRNVGSYRVELREDVEGLPGAPIPGTFKTALIRSTDPPGARHFVYPFDVPIDLPKKFWVSYQSNNANAGWILTRVQANFGWGDSTYASASGVECANATSWIMKYIVDSTARGVFDFTVYCAGEPPMGACCDLWRPDEDGAVGCLDVPRMNCPRPTPAEEHSGLAPAWHGGSTCADDPFPNECGTSACCLLDRGCENLTEAECVSREANTFRRRWNIGQYCEEETLHCPLGHCFVARNGPGCRYADCEDEVCDLDHWCCEVTWDNACARSALLSQDCGESGAGNTCLETHNWLSEVLALGKGNTVVIENADQTTSGDPSTTLFTCDRHYPFFHNSLTRWFQFVADEPTASIQTCGTRSPANDTMITVHREMDPEHPCESLEAIACSDDVPGCAGGLGSVVCLEGLTVGDTYYVEVATHSDQAKGFYAVLWESCCPEFEPDEAIASDTAAAIELAGNYTLEAGQPSNDRASSVEIDGRNALVRSADSAESTERSPAPHESYVPEPSHTGLVVQPRRTSPRAVVARGEYVSVQVNVDENGQNILGDAANEPSIAMDPLSPNRLVMGWRQSDTVSSSLAEAGVARSDDRGRTWLDVGVLREGQSGSNPVLAADVKGQFYYYSERSSYPYPVDMYRSTDGGATWEVNDNAFGGNKPWIAVDPTDGPGRGMLYAYWGREFTRSADGGKSFKAKWQLPSSADWGTMTVDPSGEVHILSRYDHVLSSENAGIESSEPVFELRGAPCVLPICERVYPNTTVGPNKGGLLYQPWIAADHSLGAHSGNLYAVFLTRGRFTGTYPTSDPADVSITRSSDGGRTWSRPVVVNQDAARPDSWQWFSTMAVGPDGRVHVAWNDSRNTQNADLVELFYAWSDDGGDTWQGDFPVSPMFDSTIGYPNNSPKLGDYYHMVADDFGVNIAYAATFNGEQDVYFLRIGEPVDCNANDVPDSDEIAKGAADCNDNDVPDACERDFDDDGVVDACDDDIDNDGVANAMDVCDFSPFGARVLGNGRTAQATSGACHAQPSDYWRFWNCHTGGLPGLPPPESACRDAFDADTDGDLDLIDAAEMQNSLSRRR